MSDDIVIDSRTCPECGFPVRAAEAPLTAVTSATAVCPFCGGDDDPRDSQSTDRTIHQLRAAFYGLPLVKLQRLKLALRAAGRETNTPELTAAGAPISPQLVEWVGSQDPASAHATLTTIADALLTLYVVSEEHAPPDQLNEVVVNIVGGRLNQLPLPRGGPCFCGIGKRYRKCHGRDAS